MNRALACLALLLWNCHSATPAPAPLTSLSVAGGRVTITGQVRSQAPVVIRNAEVRVRVDGQLLSTAGQTCATTLEQPLSCDLGNGVTLALTSVAQSGGLLLTATVSSTGSHRVDGFELLDTHAADADLELPGSPSTLKYLHNGYQSWSFAGALEISRGTTLPRTADVIQYPAPDGAASVNETVGLSSHDAVIGNTDGTAMVLGFVSTRLWQGSIALETPSASNKLTAQCGFTGDSVPLAAGSVKSETLFVKYDVSASAAMSAYGQVLSGLQQARTQAPTTKQRGWFSWNRYFDGIDEPTVEAQAAALNSSSGAQGFNLVEIDDGWEQAWGNWTVNTRFDPVATLAAARHAAGQTLGLWLAPFVVEQTESIVAAHPDWWVQTPSGMPLVHNPLATSHQLMIVDTTQPAALAWAVANLTSLQSAGVDFFKLDYLYAAALDGVRSDPNATGVSALSLGLQAVFNAIGPAQVNLCGVPWLHAALAPPATIRTGADVAYSIGAAGFALVGSATRNMTARNFGPLSHRSDPDQFWLAPLTEAEVHTALIIQALAAESFSLADDLTMLSADEQASLMQAEQLAVSLDPTTAFEARGLFDVAGTAVVPAIEEVLNGPDKVTTALPAVVVRGDLLAATNWSAAAAQIDLHLNPGESVTSIWGPAASSGKVQLDSHDTALFQLSGEAP